jgi:phosphoesterase RecJ-like protein
VASKAVYGSNSVARLELLKCSLDTLELHDGQRSAWLYVTDAMYRQTDADTEDTEGFIDYGRGIEGVGITVFIRPGSEGSWKLSFRGANSLDVGSLASELGGGGHRYAAGCDLHGSLDEVKERVRPFVTRLLSN